MANRQLTPYRRGGLTGSGGFGSFGGGGGSLFDLHREMNRLFDDLVRPGSAASQGGQAAGMLAAPALEVHQADDRIEITAELPGVKEEDIELTVEDGVLTLSGEKRSQRSDEQRGYSERTYGRFERAITLPANVDEEACKAEFRDGVLTVVLPRAAEKQRGRRIPLGSTGQQGLQQQPAAHNDSQPAPAQMAAQQPQGGTGQHGSGQHGSNKGGHGQQGS